MDVSVPEEFVSEVIPIKYALADDIANALNSLGGGGGGTVSIGSSTATTPISGIGTRTGGTTTGTIGRSTGNAGQYQPNQREWVGRPTAHHNRRHFQPAAEFHHPAGSVGNNRTNPDFWPDKNHCRRAEVIHCSSLPRNGTCKRSRKLFETGRAAFAMLHRSGHH